MSNNVKVFVYGSLKKGEINHTCMKRAGGRFLSRAVLKRPDLTFVDFGHYPGVVAHPDDKGGQSPEIKGEVWEVNQGGLAILDVLEGHPSYYCRQKLDVTGIYAGASYRAWVYVLPHGEGYEKAPLVEGGEWTARAA